MHLRDALQLTRHQHLTPMTLTRTHTIVHAWHVHTKQHLRSTDDEQCTHQSDTDNTAGSRERKKDTALRK